MIVNKINIHCESKILALGKIIRTMFLSKKYLFLILFLSVGILACQEGKAPQKETSTSTKKEEPKEEVKESEPRPSISIKANQEITSPMTIEVNSEGVWFGFEGELGTIRLLDENDKELGLGIMTAQGEWMKEGPVIYNCELTYKASKSGKGKLFVQNNNASGLKEHDKSFEIPVAYTKTE